MRFLSTLFSTADRILKKEVDFFIKMWYILYMAEIKDILAKKIIKLRTKNKMTQNELASIINYTDKSVSKWEHGDATPPIEVIKELADVFGVTVDYLISEDDDEYYDNVYVGKKNFTNKVIIACLAVLIVWLLATMLFFYSTYYELDKAWLVFIHALPVSFTVLLVFNGIWGKRKYTFILISCLVWTVLTSVFLQMYESKMWTVYLLGIPLQIATILWSQLKPKNKSKK